MLAALPAAAGPADQYREDYRYDDLGRLIQKAPATGKFEAFRYDALGNRSTKVIAGTLFELSGTEKLVVGTPQEVRIQRLGEKNLAQRVELKLTNITATAGIDYRYWLAASPATIYTADSVSITINFPANPVSNDDVVLMVEAVTPAVYGDSFKIEIYNPTDLSAGTYVASVEGAVGAGKLTYLVDEADGYAPATFVVTSTSLTAAEGTSAAVTIKRKGDTTTANNVLVSTVNGTASSGSDYTALDTSLAFAANEIQKTVSVAVLSDGASEFTEFFSVVVRAADNNGSVGRPETAIVTIPGNPPSSPSRSVRVLNTNVIEGGSAVIQFVRDGAVNVGSDTFNFFLVAGSATTSDAAALGSPVSSPIQLTFSQYDRVLPRRSVSID